jgi:hypothetical protein
VVFLLVYLGGGKAQAQTFSSGSTGNEGALNITASGVTYFDPVAMNLKPVVPGIFNFTTINVAQGSTLKFTENKYHGPVYFLASSDVTISGTLDLSGDSSNSLICNSQLSQRIPNAAGSGGFSGGISYCGTNYPALPGNGPGGGTAASSTNTYPTGGTNSSNQFLVPLIGGSGGGGMYSPGALATNGFINTTGGAGAGAILIASSTTITINGVINATGGNGSCSSSGAGAGAGGSVRLVANTIQGSGNVNVVGGQSCGQIPAKGVQSGGGGTVRFESNNLGGVTVVTASTGPFGTGCASGSGQGSNFGLCGASYRSSPYPLTLPALPTPSIKVTSINGVPINSNPFTFPDITINTGSSVPVTIQAQYVPVGTIANIYVFSDGGPDQVISIGPLTGTDSSSTTATANITYPPGGSHGYVKATW